MKMKYVLLSLCFITVFSFSVKAGEAGQLSLHWQEPVGKNFFPIAYYLYEPKIEAGKKYPLILALHGAGKRGYGGIKAFEELRSELVQKKYPCYVIIPQCPGKMNEYELSLKAKKGMKIHAVDPKNEWQEITITLGKLAPGKKNKIVIMGNPINRKKGACKFQLRNLRVVKPDSKELKIDLKGKTPKIAGKWGRNEIPMYDSKIDPDGNIIINTQKHGGGILLEIDPVDIAPGDVVKMDVKFEEPGAGHTISFLPGLTGEFKKSWQWVNTNWAGKKPHKMTQESNPMKSAVAILKKVTAEKPIDPTRIYVTGNSMGGYGTWDIICRYPDIFAAAIPICGGAPDDVAKRVPKVPIWTFHGDKDRVVHTARSRQAVEALKKAGSPIKYTAYPGVSHNSWTRTYQNPEVYEWLFKQQK